VARTRTVSDDAILDAAARVILARGPHDFTLAHVAKAARLAPATLLQRFGSKRRLLVAFARREAAHAADPFEQLLSRPTKSKRRSSPVPELAAALRALARGHGDRRSLASSMALLVMDIRDDALRTHARTHAARVEDAIFAQLVRAAERGAIDAPDLRALARLVHAAWNGALLSWGVQGKGSLDAWTSGTLETLLDLARPRRPRRRR
jgi:AcrR family transcriptional regulator